MLKISENTNIHEDGFKIWNVKFKKNESEYNMLKKLKQLSLKELGKDYIFLDYKYHLKEDKGFKKYIQDFFSFLNFYNNN